LRELEEQFPHALVVIGVHSGKFIAERDTERIQHASHRLSVGHAVVNDRQFRVWRAYAVRAWPTIVVLDARGYVVGMHAGEFTTDTLAPAIGRLIEAAGDTLVRTPPEHPTIDVPGPNAPRGQLHYPGKVAVDGKRIAIADSGRHRVLVGSLDDTGRRATILASYGGEPGFRDGADPRFHSPQGLAFHGDMLYVADAENHVVRAIDLSRGEGRTLAGTGHQLRTRADLAAGALSSPWDLAVVGDSLFVAMAGNHRLYSIGLRDSTLRHHAGSGAEEIEDGPLLEAALAQPMGVCAVGDRLYFTDSESSAIRWADTNSSGNVGTIVGTGLFDFGDVDGEGNAVRLQHPQGIAPHASGRLLVADSYNDSLKWVDPSTRRAERWIGGLHEPGGVAIGGTKIYVADTNAHRIAVVDEHSAEVTTLDLT
jgi:DNA-binding beta-propeller fold protein YncE